MPSSFPPKAKTLIIVPVGGIHWHDDDSTCLFSYACQLFVWCQNPSSIEEDGGEVNLIVATYGSFIFYSNTHVGFLTFFDMVMILSIEYMKFLKLQPKA